MSEKIVVVSMAKNEADIIESFVRYYMTFVDGIIIVDHNSDDDTGKILTELQKEYPSLIVDQLKTIEHIQSEVMTNLVKIAAHELGADLILPLDIDEFLIPKHDIGCRSILEKIVDDVVALEWVDHELVNPEQGRDKFILSRLCNKSATMRTMTKVFVNGSFVRNHDIRLTQGNHGLRIQSEDGTEALVPARRNSELVLAHFPFRSQGQYMSKNAIGWLTNAMRYSATTVVAPHWKSAFDKICDNDCEIPTIPDSQFVGKLYDGNIDLKYTDSKPIEVLPRVLKLAEKICDKYARQNTLSKVSTVTVVMPIGQDLDAVVGTVGSLLSQTMINWRLVIIAPYDLDAGIRAALMECDSRIHIIGIGDDIALEGFVKFIIPGRKLSPECLEMEAVALYNHSEFNFTYSNGKDIAGADVVADVLSIIPGIDIWNGIKDASVDLTGGISGMMLRKIPHELQISKVIENYMWKEKEILGILLPKNLLFVFPDRLV